jgi:hypothetical protein
LHAFLALGGTYLLANRLFGNPATSILGAFFYAWGGFFAAQSSRLSLFEAAALFPWLIWAALGALETGDRRRMASVGLLSGIVVLAGDFDAAVYAFFGLTCVVIANRGSGKRSITVLTVAAAGAILIGAVVIWPWFEMVSQLRRADAGQTRPALEAQSLGTLLSADYLGMLSGRYRGPADFRHAYFYGGLLAVPLMVAGLVRRTQIAVVAALIVPALWYGFGPAAGLARWMAVIPSFRDTRAPAEIWFVMALGIAMAAASGAAWIAERAQRPRLPVVLIVLTAADLWFWNFYKNPMVLARVSFEELYGKPQAKFEDGIRDIKQRPFYRLWAEQPLPTLGPLDGPLAARTSVTFGSGLLGTNRYAEYMQASRQNPRLLNSVATHAIEVRGGAVRENPDALGLVSAPANVTFVATEEAARAKLGTLDPAREVLVEGSERILSSRVSSFRIIRRSEIGLELSYSGSDSLLRFSIPYAIGWRATVDGRDLPIFPTDLALAGVIVPAGEHELKLAYRTPGLTLGAGLSLLGVATVLGFLLTGSKRSHSGR